MLPIMKWLFLVAESGGRVESGGARVLIPGVEVGVGAGRRRWGWDLSENRFRYCRSLEYDVTLLGYANPGL